MLHGVEERIVDAAGECGGFEGAADGGDFGEEIGWGVGVLWGDLQEAVAVDFVVDFAEAAGLGALDGDGVAGADLAEIEDVLGGG